MILMRSARLELDIASAATCVDSCVEAESYVSGQELLAQQATAGSELLKWLRPCLGVLKEIL